MEYKLDILLWKMELIKAKNAELETKLQKQIFPQHAGKVIQEKSQGYDTSAECLDDYSISNRHSLISHVADNSSC